MHPAYRRLAVIAQAVDVNSPLGWRRHSALFLSQRKQKQDDADAAQNRRGGKACGRNLGPGMVILFKVPSEAD